MSPAKASKGRKTTTKKPAKKPRATVSDLHRMTGLDRGTILKRLQTAKLQPDNEKQYDIARSMKALLNDRTGITEERRRNLVLKNQQLERDLAQDDSLPRTETLETLQRIFNSLFQRLVIQNPRDNKARYHRMKTPDQLAVALKQDMAQVFDDLRANFKSFL